mgnify:CR=1 FL=1
MRVALISSTRDLFLRWFLLRPLVIMDRKAILEVKRSSTLSTGISGNWLFKILINFKINGSLFESLLFICFGNPTTMRSTVSKETYDFKNSSKLLVLTVVKPEAIICISSVTAIPVRLLP